VQNRVYCTKDVSRAPGNESGPFEIGDLKEIGQGSRSDIYSFTKLIAVGEQWSEIARQAPEAYIRYHQGAHKLRLALSGAYDEGELFRDPPEVYVLSGPTGVGKSHFARNLAQRRGYERNEVYTLAIPSSGDHHKVYWEGFQNQKFVIIEEFAGQIPIHQLKQMLDKYDYRVEVKSSSSRFAPEVVVITSQRPYREWYTAPSRTINNSIVRFEQDLAALKRRFTHIYTYVPCTEPEIRYHTRLYPDVSGRKHYIRELELARRREIADAAALPAPELIPPPSPFDAGSVAPSSFDSLSPPVASVGDDSALETLFPEIDWTDFNTQTVQESLADLTLLASP
jgi:hypothetical protein